MFQRYSHTMLFVNDMVRAVRWYKDVLGFAESFVAETFYASLRNDDMGCRLDLHFEEGKANIGVGPVPYFQTEKFDEALSKLRSAGVSLGEARKEGSSLRFVDFRDSEGNILGLQEVA